MFSLENKRILVTGGTGSMGQTFVRRVLSGELGTPRKVIVFSRDEAKQHDMRMSYQNNRAATEEVIYRNFMNVLEFRIGDVRSYSDVCSSVKDVDIVVYDGEGHGFRRAETIIDSLERELSHYQKAFGLGPGS